MKKKLPVDYDEQLAHNNEQVANMLKQVSPELYEVYEAMQMAEVSTNNIVKFLYMVGNVKRFSKWGKITMLIQDGKEVKVDQAQGFKLED